MDLLIVIAALWLAAASFTDLKKREVADWLSFSLMAIALSFRASESVISGSIQPLATSLIGMMAFFIIANILYHGKIFAGGDAKILTAFGAIIPGIPILANLLIVGGAYGLVYSLFLGAINLKQIYPELIVKGEAESNPLLIFLITLIIAGVAINFAPLYLISMALTSIYLLEIFVRVVEKKALTKKVSPNKLTEGDWLVKDVALGKTVVRANFEGLTKKDIELIKKAKKDVYVKYGIPFIPVFLIALLITIKYGNLFLFLMNF